MMKLACILVLTLTPVAARADKLSLADLSAYLNSFQTAKGAFTQINGDGSTSNGTLYIKRPGRMRFEYAPPEKTLVVAGGGAVAIYDPKAGPNPETYPLNKTPLSIILARQVDLARARMVTGHDYDGSTTTITAQDPDHPEYGSIQMKFTSDPVQLRQWVLNDEGGNATTVVLGPLATGGALGDTLFTIDVVKDGQR